MTVESSFYKRWLNVLDVAKYLDLKPSTVYSLTSKREIPFCKKGGILRFDRDEIDSWVKEGRIETKREYLERISKKGRRDDGETSQEER